MSDENKSLMPMDANFLPDLNDEAALQRYIEANRNVGRENLSRSDLILPYWRLLQNNAGPNAGKFKSNSGDIRDELDITVLVIQPNRILWPEEYDGDNSEPICKSLDGNVSVSGHACTPNGCPFAHYKLNGKKACEWGDDGQPPSCKAGYVVVCIENNTNEPILIPAFGTSVAPVKHFNSRTGFGGKGLWEYRVLLKSERVEDKKTSWYEQRYEIKEEHPLKRKVQLLQAAKSLMSMNILKDSMAEAARHSSAAEITTATEVEARTKPAQPSPSGKAVKSPF